jgi:Fur family peroxide stress response transcriptional regulator
MEENLKQFREICKKNGLRITKQKEGIYLILLMDHSHPTADDIFQQVKKLFPKISFATVYDNLRKFKNIGLVRELNCGENCRRYEAKMEPHHHIIDSSNGTVTDVFLNEDQNIPLPPSLKGKAIKEIKISYII